MRVIQRVEGISDKLLMAWQIVWLSAEPKT